MARPSKLPDSEWDLIRKRMMAGEKAADLAREYGVSKAAISMRVSKRIETIKTVANQILSADVALRSLPISEQIDTVSLVDDLKSISKHLASAGRYGAATAHRLSAIANDQVQKINDVDPFGEVGPEAMRGVAALTSLANESSKIGLNLLAANKDQLAPAQQSVPSGLDHFYGGSDQ